MIFLSHMQHLDFKKKDMSVKGGTTGGKNHHGRGRKERVMGVNITEVHYMAI
jgi:hypothetical protein